MASTVIQYGGGGGGGGQSLYLCGFESLCILWSKFGEVASYSIRRNVYESVFSTIWLIQ